MATDLTIVLEDRPGELARVGEVLGGAGINIEGVAASVDGGRGIVHLLVEDAAGARAALADQGIEVAGEAEALVMDLPADEPGTLGQMARKVADAGINLQVVYLATGNRGVAVTSDNAAAAAALG